MKTLLTSILFISSLLAAEENIGSAGAFMQKNKSSKSFEMCTEYMEKNGIRFQLGQIWFVSGIDPKEAKPLENYSVDYNDKPFSHNFSFSGLPKERLWADCVYFSCGDAACSPESSGSDPESVYHEIKNIPMSCKSKVKKENATRIEYFTCKYKQNSKNKTSSLEESQFKPLPYNKSYALNC